MDWKLGCGLLLGATLLPLQAAQINISDIRASGLDHGSIRWTFAVSSAPAYVQVLYGTAAGVYPYASASFKATADGVGDKRASVAIGALKPNTRYYFRMTARPNADNDIDVCKTDACGSTEQVIMTAAEPIPHPAMPEAPAVYRPLHPDTSTYRIVTMQVAANGQCVAAATVAGTTIAGGDTIPTVLSKAGYGSILEFPQGAVCRVEQSQVNGTGMGYSLPALPLDTQAGGNVDSPNHRWIVLRTKAESEADFPPFGVRTNPAWSGKMAKLVAQTPGNTWGQIFNFSEVTNGAQGAHHFWIENLEFTTINDPSIISADAADPKPFPPLIRIVTMTSPKTIPNYIVLDRLYVHTGPFPARSDYGVVLGGRNVAMVGCYSNFDYWRMASWPTNPPTLDPSRTILNVPAATFQRNIKDAPTGMKTAARVTLNAPGQSGSLAGFVGPNGLTVQYTAGTITCSGCDAVLTPSPARPANAYAYFTATITNGVFTNLAANTAQWQTTSSDWRPISLALAGSGPILIENNFLGGAGMSVYVDPVWAFSTNDVVFRRNHIFWSQTQRRTSPTWDGYGHDVRNQLEVKRGHRWLLDGNVFEGQWSYQNSGMAIFLWSVVGYTTADTTTGISDFTITNNIVRHAPMMMMCSSTENSPDYADSYVGARFLVQNNLAYDLNRYVYDDAGPGRFLGGYIANYSCQDFSVRNNTFGRASAPAPYILATGGGRSLVEGFDMSSNILYLGFGDYGGIRNNDACIEAGGQGCLTSHPRLPLTTGSTYKQQLDSYFVRTGDTVTPDYTFTNNVIIGGTTGSDPAKARDLTAAEMNGFASQFPPRNFFRERPAATVLI